MTAQKLLAAVLLVSAAAVTGCHHQPPISGRLQTAPDRGKRLLSLAAREAAAIQDADMRLTRQLNLADQQLARGWQADARQTLAEAEATLRSDASAKLNDHTRLSGWISVSQLNRRADDAAAADRACQQAILAMRRIEDPAKRCEYVMGIANEVQYLRGQEPAARLLIEAGPWTQSIDEVTRRRQAVVSFASALFNLDDYDAGQRMLQQEGDAAWRSDTLSQLAAMAGRRGIMPDLSAAKSSSIAPFFGRRLDYERVFQNQVKSNVEVDVPATRPAIK